MLSQPPPNAPAPPPSKAEIRSGRYRIGFWIVGVSSFAGIIYWKFLPIVERQRRKAEQTYACNNSIQIGICLHEFEKEYGKFPDTTTIAAIRARTGTTLSLGTKTSNDYFRQLVATGIGPTEMCYYAKIAGSHKPDGVKGSHTLDRGECAFSYIVGLSPAGNLSRPVIVTPLIPGTDRFDPTAFDGKAIMLKMDYSINSYPIDKDGHVLVDGVNILDPAHPVWAGEKWTLAWPE